MSDLLKLLHTPFKFEFDILGTSLGFRISWGQIEAEGGGEPDNGNEYDRSSTTASESSGGNNERFFGFDHRSNRIVPGDVEA